MMFKCQDCFMFRKSFPISISKDKWHEKYGYCMRRSIYLTQKKGILYFLKKVPIDTLPKSQTKLCPVEKRIKVWGYGDNDMVLRKYDPSDCVDFINPEDAIQLLFGINVKRTLEIKKEDESKIENKN